MSDSRKWYLLCLLYQSNLGEAVSLAVLSFATIRIRVVHVCACPIEYICARHNVCEIVRVVWVTPTGNEVIISRSVGSLVGLPFPFPLRSHRERESHSLLHTRHGHKHWQVMMPFSLLFLLNSATLSFTPMATVVYGYVDPQEFCLLGLCFAFCGGSLWAVYTPGCFCLLYTSPSPRD